MEQEEGVSLAGSNDGRRAPFAVERDRVENGFWSCAKMPVENAPEIIHAVPSGRRRSASILGDYAAER
jgi:hypothetical protein